MKNRIKLIFLGIFFAIIIGLTVYTFKRTPKCNRVHIDEMVTFVVSDERAAREIADLVTGIENSVEDTVYEVEIEFDEPSFEWVVRYISKRMQEADGEKESVTVRIRKDNGIITLDDNRSN